MFDTQKSRPVWSVRSAELWELGKIDGEMIRVRRLGDWDSVPLSLAQDSFSADVTAALVDIGKRTVSDIRGWLVTEIGVVPIEYVEEYLEALESIDVIRKKPGSE
jgi:hypothetical protein